MDTTPRTSLPILRKDHGAIERRLARLRADVVDVDQIIGDLEASLADAKQKLAAGNATLGEISELEARLEAKRRERGHLVEAAEAQEQEQGDVAREIGRLETAELKAEHQAAAAPLRKEAARLEAKILDYLTTRPLRELLHRHADVRSRQARECSLADPIEAPALSTLAADVVDAWEGPRDRHYGPRHKAIGHRQDVREFAEWIRRILVGPAQQAPIDLADLGVEE